MATTIKTQHRTYALICLDSFQESGITSFIHAMFSDAYNEVKSEHGDSIARTAKYHVRFGNESVWIECTITIP